MTTTKGKEMSDETVQQVAQTVGKVLELGDRTGALDAETKLFGAIPELDSLAVLELIAALETQFGVEFEADDVTGDAFESIGTLAAVIDRRQA